MDNEIKDLDSKPHLWKKGRAKTGGRKKGDPNESMQSKTTRLMSKMAASNKTQIADIVETVTKLALAGDVALLKELMTRLWPAPRGRALDVKMPIGMGLGGISAGFDAILEAINEGRVTASEGSELASILRQQADILGARDLELRLAALERDAA
jgi:hypothetical protein